MISNVFWLPVKKLVYYSSYKRYYFLCHAVKSNYGFCLFSAPVARLIKFYRIPLLTAGGLSFSFTEPKAVENAEFYLLTKTGYSFEHIAKFIYDFFKG